MLEALLENKQSAAEIAELGHWSLAPKIPQIIEALEGHRMTDHHRFMIRQCLRHMRAIEETRLKFQAGWVADRVSYNPVGRGRNDRVPGLDRLSLRNVLKLKKEGTIQ